MNSLTPIDVMNMYDNRGIMLEPQLNVIGIDPYNSQRVVFYTEMMDLMGLELEKKESLSKLLYSSDQETMVIFKELFNSIFYEFLKDKFKTGENEQ